MYALIPSGSRGIFNLRQETPPGRVVEVVDDAVRHHQIPAALDLVVVEIGHDTLDRDLGLLGEVAELADPGRGAVDGGHGAAETCQIEGVAAFAAAQVEYPGLPWEQRDEFDDVVVRAAHRGDSRVPGIRVPRTRRTGGRGTPRLSAGTPP